MKVANGSCPYCGRKIFNYDQRQWFYGSPIITCKKCGESYLDERYHEIAVEGIAPDAMDLKESLSLMIFGFAVFVIALALAMPSLMAGHLPTKPLLFAVCGFCVTVFMLIDVIRIKTGLKEKRFAQLRIESEQRLKSGRYAAQLKELGYAVPEKYTTL